VSSEILGKVVIPESYMPKAGRMEVNSVCFIHVAQDPYHAIYGTLFDKVRGILLTIDYQLWEKLDDEQ
jgi:hypothetical protein